MPKTFSYTSDQVAELQEAYLAETGRNQRKIQIVMLRAQGMKVNDVIKITKTSTTTITRLTKLYADKRVPGLCASNYHGHNQYLTYDREAEFLKQFDELAATGQITTPQEMHKAYQELVGHKTTLSGFYLMLHRHHWRKLLPRPHHPKQADADSIQASKKLTPKSKN